MSPGREPALNFNKAVYLVISAEYASGHAEHIRGALPVTLRRLTQNSAFMKGRQKTRGSASVSTNVRTYTVFSLWFKQCGMSLLQAKGAAVHACRQKSHKYQLWCTVQQLGGLLRKQKNWDLNCQHVKTVKSC